MDIASLVLGIIGVILGFIPFCNWISWILCLIGVILGVVAIVQKNKINAPKGMAVAGTVLSAIGLVFSLWWVFVVGALL